MILKTSSLTLNDIFVHLSILDWQLMETPISLQEFEDLPLLRSTFFHFGLGLEGANAASIISCNER